MAANDRFYAAAERRIEYFTAGAGLVGAIMATAFAGTAAGIGVAAGAALSWLNLRWLRQGVRTLANLATAQAGAEKPRVPKSTYFKFLGRYVLLLAAGYVILSRFHLTAWPLVAGLFAPVAGVMMELTAEIFGAVRGKGTGSASEDA